MKPGDPLPLCLRDLRVAASSQPILEGVSLDLQERELISIVGPSGAGKSTLLRVVNRLAEDAGFQVSGMIRYRGKEIHRYPFHQLRTRIGMVFQKPCVYPGSILRNVLFGVRHHQRLSRRASTALAEDMLRRGRLWEEVKDRLARPAAHLSLGQKQRLCFARVLAVDPDVLLLDEPTSSLDPHSTREIERTLLELKAEKSILLVTHLLEQARRLSDRAVFLSASSGVGRIIEVGHAEELFERPREVETRAYLVSRDVSNIPGRLESEIHGTFMGEQGPNDCRGWTSWAVRTNKKGEPE